MNEAELKAQAEAARIVKITNIFDFEYTHAWGGVPYTLPVGKPLLFPYPLGKHLATHLARQALIRKAPTRDANEVDGKGKDRPLWNEEVIADLVSKIMVEQYTEERQPVLSEAEQMKRKIEELNRQFEEFKAASAPNAQQTQETAPEVAPQAPEVAPNAPETAPSAPQTAPEAITYKDKGEVIAALKARNITFDARKGKAELEKLLATPQQ